MRRTVRFLLLVSLALLIPGMARGDTATQTDWSGGYGVPGPVTDWGTRFDAAESIAWASGAGAFALAPDLPTPHDVTQDFNEPAGVIAVDIDGDDDLDIASVAFAGNEIAWWENDGSGGGWSKHRIAVGFGGATGLCAAYINDDGYIDIAGIAEQDDEAAWWENNGSGTSWIRHDVDTNVNGPFSIEPADFDQDEDIDLCAAVFYAHDLVWWENTDGVGGNWTRHTIDEDLSGAWAAVPADVDADQDFDIVAAAYGDNQICWYRNTGGGTVWTKEVVDWSFPAPVSLRARDLDGDTDVDILASSYAGSVAWWENSGSRWTKHPIADGLNVAFCTYAEDLDGDGDQDVISNERESDRLLWWENADAIGTLWIPHVVDETGDGPSGVTAVDINGDTHMNIVSVFSFNHSIRWYEFSGNHTGSGTLESSILDADEVVSNWGTIDWICTEPPNTSVTVDVRGSDNPSDMGSWATVAAPGDDLSSYVGDDARYVQYRVSLATSDSAVSPVFGEIRVTWNQTGAVEEHSPLQGGFMLRPGAPHPSSPGTATIRYALPYACDVSLLLIDAEGRKVSVLAEGAHEAGEYVATATGLSSGIYFCRMGAPVLQDACKLIVR